MTAVAGYIIGAQAAIEVTLDEFGDITLRQDDCCITVSANNIDLLIDILHHLDGGEPPPDYRGRPIEAAPSEIEAPPTVPAKARRTDNSNAERQRRYRESKRNVKRNAVTQDASELFTDMTDRADK